MSTMLRWLLVLAVVITIAAVYLYRVRKPDLKVEPHAAQEIEKAKRR